MDLQIGDMMIADYNKRTDSRARSTKNRIDYLVVLEIVQDDDGNVVYWTFDISNKTFRTIFGGSPTTNVWIQG